MDYWPLIVKTAVANGANPVTIKKWKQRGVPYRWRYIIEDAAKDAGQPIPRDAFDFGDGANA